MSSWSGCSVEFSSSSLTVDKDEGGERLSRCRDIGLDEVGDAEDGGDMRPENEESDGDGDRVGRVYDEELGARRSGGGRAERISLRREKFLDIRI